MAVALASSPAACVRALQRCVVGHASGRSRSLLLRASPSQSQLQSQPLKCGGACSRKLGGPIVGSRLQRFSIVASSMGSPTPSQVGFWVAAMIFGIRDDSIPSILFGEADFGFMQWKCFLNWSLCLNYFKQGLCCGLCLPLNLMNWAWCDLNFGAN